MGRYGIDQGARIRSNGRDADAGVRKCNLQVLAVLVAAYRDGAALWHGGATVEQEVREHLRHLAAAAGQPWPGAIVADDAHVPFGELGFHDGQRCFNVDNQIVPLGLPLNGGGVAAQVLDDAADASQTGAPGRACK